MKKYECELDKDAIDVREIVCVWEREREREKEWEACPTTSTQWTIDH